MKSVGGGEEAVHNVQFGAVSGSLVPAPEFTRPPPLLNPIWFLPYGFQRIPPPSLRIPLPPSLPNPCSNATMTNNGHHGSEFLQNILNTSSIHVSGQNECAILGTETAEAKSTDLFNSTAVHNSSPWLNQLSQHGSWLQQSRRRPESLPYVSNFLHQNHDQWGEFKSYNAGKRNNTKSNNNNIADPATTPSHQNCHHSHVMMNHSNNNMNYSRSMMSLNSGKISRRRCFKSYGWRNRKDKQQHHHQQQQQHLDGSKFANFSKVKSWQSNRFNQNNYTEQRDENTRNNNSSMSNCSSGGRKQCWAKGPHHHHHYNLGGVVLPITASSNSEGPFLPLNKSIANNNNDDACSTMRNASKKLTLFPETATASCCQQQHQQNEWHKALVWRIWNINHSIPPPPPPPPPLPPPPHQQQYSTTNHLEEEEGEDYALNNKFNDDDENIKATGNMVEQEEVYSANLSVSHASSDDSNQMNIVHVVVDSDDDKEDGDQQGQQDEDFMKKRHGRVQSVKFLSDDSSTANIGGNGGIRTGKSATVAFIDIRSAAKALRAVHSMAGQPLQITYHEPGSVPPRSILPTEHSSPGDVSATANETNTNSVSTLAPGNPIASVSGPGISNGPNSSVSSPVIYRQQRFPVQHGQSEDSSSHFYEQQPKGFTRGRGDGHGFHGRGRREHRHPYHNNRHNNNSFPGDRNYRMSWGYPNEGGGRFAPPAHSDVDERTSSGPPPSSHPPQNENNSKGPRRPDSPASSVSSRHLPSKRHKSRSDRGSSGSSDRGSSGGSRSRSGSRSSCSTSVSSGRSRSPAPHHGSSGHYSNSRGGSPGARFAHQTSYSRQRYSRSRLISHPADSSRVRHGSRSPVAATPSSSASSSPSPSPHRKITAAPHSPSHSPSSAKSYSPSRSLNQTGHHHHHHRRTPNSAELHSAIKIRNLPIRSSDTSLKDGLYHEYKKHGKVSWVRVIGAGSERFAIVCFKSSEHATRAVALSQDKQFFGNKILVSAYYSRGDEPLGGAEEDNRGLGDDEPTSVSFPTRTVLITGLDPNITPTELKAAFDQYGDIVTIDIRKQGASTHAVCEFVDIASAIRAQWGRHVFKAREARISFFRAPPSSSLLLDGTDGVNEKQITGHCGQYGAISRVIMDTGRILALVQFDEISSAQTAIRELRSWVIKGKHLHVDFASPECIRMFLERIAGRGGVIRSGNSSPPNLRVTTTPPLSIGGIALKEGIRRSNRRFTECSDERKSPYNPYNNNNRHTNDMDFEGTKPMTTQLRMLDDPAASPESACSAQLRQGEVGNVISGGGENSVIGGMGYRRRRGGGGFTSPVSPDPEHLHLGVDDDSLSEVGGGNGGKSEHSKIDLSCHETDSAVVTSSSDVILENDINPNHDSSSMNGDEKHNNFETVRINSHTSCKSKVVVATVDGVSSTSPEPKSLETVRKSPDPGVGVESTPRIIGDPHIITTGLIDPRKKANDSKIRRSSADSGSNVIQSTVFGQHTNHNNNSSNSSSVPSIYASNVLHVNTNINHCNHVVSCEGGEESDDRPGTPLCDENPENPESFVTTENNNMTIKLPPRTLSHSSKNDPLSLPLPEFALQQRYSHYNNNNNNNSLQHGRHNSVSVIPSRDSMFAMRMNRSSSETNIIKSPIKSPVYDGGTTSVMNSSASECDIFSPTPVVVESKTISDRHSNTLILLSSSNTSTNRNNINNSWNVGDELSVGSGGDPEGHHSKHKEQIVTVSPRIEIVDDDDDDHDAHQDKTLVLNSKEEHGGGSSSDSESGCSPTGASLEQRIKKFYERYDQWNGNRSTVRSSTVPLHQGAQATLDNLGKSSLSSTMSSSLSNSSESAETSSSSTMSRFHVRTKHKVLDLDEMRHQPSDIVKSLLAKKSVFDEDSKRLENFGEKYEAKSVNITGANWRLALNRSSSTASTSSTASSSNASASAQTPPPPITPTTPNVTPSTTTFPLSSASSSTPCNIPLVRNPSPSNVMTLPPAITTAAAPPPSSSSTNVSKSQQQCHHSSSNHSGSPSLGKPAIKDLVVSNPNPMIGNWVSNNNQVNNNGKSVLMTKSPSPSGPSPSLSSLSSSSKSTNIASSLIPLPSLKLQTDTVNKLPISSSSSLTPPASIPKHLNGNEHGSSSNSPTCTTITNNSNSSNNNNNISNVRAPSNSNHKSLHHPAPNNSVQGNNNNVIQSGIHHGIPRMVERSMSLDSKRSLTQISTTTTTTTSSSNVSSSAGCSPTSASNNNNVSTLTSSCSGSTIQNDRPPSRRISVDTQSSLMFNEVPYSSSSASRKSIDSLDNLNCKISKDTTSSPTTTILTKEKTTKGVLSTTTKDELPNKNVSLIKCETPIMAHQSRPQETTVAVVATVQTPLIVSKDSKKDSRDKKRRASGSSTPIQANSHNSSSTPGINNNNNNSFSSTSASMKSSSSGKDRKDKEKEKDLKKTPSEDNPGTGGNNNNNLSHPHHSAASVHSSSSNHGKNKNKDKTKEEKDSSGGGESVSSAPTVNPSSTVKDSHNHRKEKEKEVSKMKRRLSSQDSEQQGEPKKMKVDKRDTQGNNNKDAEQSPHSHHRSKHSSSTSERRESRDSSSSTKDKTKEKLEKERELGKSDGCVTSSSSNSKDKEHHHKSKQSSGSSSSSKHHHQVKDKSKTSTDGHSSSSHSHKPSSSELSKKKDKVSPGKESSSGKSKHSSSSSSHGHSHHSSGGGSSSKKESSSSKSSSSRSVNSKDTKIKDKHGSTAIDSEDESDMANVPLGAEKDKDRDKLKDRGEKHEKRDSSSKRDRDRHKSGGDSSSAGLDPLSKSSRSKQEKKKRRRYVIDETDSSDTDEGDEDKQKHHSIFEVFVDEYVSMYDKVKARSNRACKYNAGSQPQKDEPPRKQDKSSKDPLHHSMKSKREDKKRSTSTERKSFPNTSSDESNHHDSDDTSKHGIIERERECHRDSSDEERQVGVDRHEVGVDERLDNDDQQHNHKISGSISKSSVSKSHQKTKSRSSKGKNGSKQKGNRSNKSSPSGGTSFPSASSIFFSHSDEDSHTGSPPMTKKIKLKHQFQAMSTTSSISHQIDTKSSDDSQMSDFDDSNVIISNVTKPSSSKTKFSINNNASKLNKKLRMVDIYSDSDSSVRSNRGNKHVAPTPNSKSKSIRDKIGKQKSLALKKSLFDDSTESSGVEDSATTPTITTTTIATTSGSTPASATTSKKEKESKDAPSSSSKSKSKDKEKENKSSNSSTNRKKHSHSTSLTNSKSSSSSCKGSSSSRRQRVSSGDAVSGGPGNVHLSTSSSASTKRESVSTIKDILFGSIGSITSTSCSDIDDKPPIEHERPKTPTMVLPTSSIAKEYEDTPVSTKSKSKSSRSKLRKSSSNTIHHGSHSSVDDASLDSTLVTPPVTSSSGKTSSSSEKKKKKHHRERRSKRTESQDTPSSSINSTFDQVKVKAESVDLDSLFNSPVPSPKTVTAVVAVVPKEEANITPPHNSIMENSILNIEVPRGHFLSSKCRISPAIMDHSVKSTIDKEKLCHDADDDCVANMKSMFSTDEDDDDDDNKLKIDINEAIMASDDQHDDPECKDEEDTQQKQRTEEEEQKLHCLFEQDKAIESIVLLDRKTPPIIVTEEEVNPKDEIPKDETAISQEETEDAVAALLETLEGDDTIHEDNENNLEKSASPPTIRIIEEVPPVGDGDNELEPAVDIPIPESEKGESWYDTKSPKDLQIDEGAEIVVDNNNENETAEGKVRCESNMVDDYSATTGSSNLSKTPDHDDSTKLATPVQQLGEDLIQDKPASSTASRKSSLQQSSSDIADEECTASQNSSSADVYEFHDSDEEKVTETTPQPLAHSKSTTVPVPTIKSPTSDVSSNTTTTAAVMTPIAATTLVVPTSPQSTPAMTSPQISLPSPVISSGSLPAQSLPAGAGQKVMSTVIKSDLAVPLKLTSPPPPLFSTSPSTALPGAGNEAKTSPALAATTNRTTVDDTIDEVIRMVQNDTLIEPSTAAHNTLVQGQKAAAAAFVRARSKSKDSQDESFGANNNLLLSSSPTITPVVSTAVNKVLLTKPPESSPRRSNNNTPVPHPLPPTTSSSSGLPMAAFLPNAEQYPPPTPATMATIFVKGEKEPDSNSAVMETLIDPKTGLLIPMLRKSDEYIPMAQNQNQQAAHQLHQHHLQISLSQSRTAEIISKAMEQRPMNVVEKLPLSMQQQQQQNQHLQHQVFQKAEGLQLQQLQQQQMMHQQHQKQMQQHFQQQQQQHQQHQQQQHANSKNVMSNAQVPPKTAVIYTSSGPFIPSKPGFPQLPVHSTQQLTGQPLPSPGLPGSPGGPYGPPKPGQGPQSMSKPPTFGNQQQQQQQQASPQGIPYHHMSLIRPTDQLMMQQQQQRAVGPGSIRPPPPTHASMQQQQQQQQNMQSQGVRIPPLPSATTITKVSHGEDQQRKSTIIQHPNVILTTTSAAQQSAQSLGIGSGSVVRAVVPPPHPHQQHSQQPVQIQHAELLRMGRIMGKDEGNQQQQQQPISRPQDGFGQLQQPRVEIGGSVVVTASPSPKAGRVPQQHEQAQPQSTQQRLMSQHHAYDPTLGDVRALQHVRPPLPEHYQTASHQQVVYPTHFIPASMAASLPPGQQSPYSLRQGAGDKMVQQQQQDKRGTPELHKGGATLTLVNPERVGPPHHIPAHLASPHQAERGTESPLVATVYGGAQRHLYGTPVPAHHQPVTSHHRQTFSNPYADFVEERPFSNSPSYAQYDPHRVVAVERERERNEVIPPYSGVVTRLGRGVSPPPAHSRYNVHPIPGTEVVPSSNDRQRPPQVQTPPNGGQVSNQGDSLLMLLQRYPIMWQGLLALKNDNAACQMHFVSGNVNVARDSLPSQPDGTVPPLRISQRMRLEQTQLEGVARKMQMEPEHCMLLALPCGRDHMDVLQQSNNLRHGFITYLQLKQAAGIVNICHPITQQPAYVIHIFPSCDFANENLARIAPDLLNGVADIAHLLIVIATV